MLACKSGDQTRIQVQSDTSEKRTEFVATFCVLCSEFHVFQCFVAFCCNYLLHCICRISCSCSEITRILRDVSRNGVNPSTAPVDALSYGASRSTTGSEEDAALQQPQWQSLSALMAEDESEEDNDEDEDEEGRERRTQQHQDPRPTQQILGRISSANSIPMIASVVRRSWSCNEAQPPLLLSDGLREGSGSGSICRYEDSHSGSDRLSGSLSNTFSHSKIVRESSFAAVL